MVCCFTGHRKLSLFEKKFAVTELRRTIRALAAEGYFGDDPILSMGMSDNYALAAAYGSTLVRPGTAVFGARQYPKTAKIPASAELHKNI